MAAHSDTGLWPWQTESEGEECLILEHEANVDGVQQEDSQ